MLLLPEGSRAPGSAVTSLWLRSDGPGLSLTCPQSLPPLAVSVPCRADFLNEETTPDRQPLSSHGALLTAHGVGQEKAGVEADLGFSRERTLRRESGRTGGAAGGPSEGGGGWRLAGTRELSAACQALQKSHGNATKTVRRHSSKRPSAGFANGQAEPTGCLRAPGSAPARPRPGVPGGRASSICVISS